LSDVERAEKPWKKMFQLEKTRILMEQTQEKVLVELLLGLILMKPHC